jgi:choline dehydrogenase-like flavoprotein
MRHKCDGVHGVATDLASNDTLDQWLLRNVSTMHYIWDTCKIGPVCDMLAVVDQHGRVHGLTGLHVVGASICQTARGLIPMLPL